MKCYTPPYDGDQEYLFFSYCHDDAARVYPIIERLTIEGFRVWYDDGIHPGEDWPDVIAAHLSRAKACAAAVSSASTESHNCRNEITFAVTENKPLLSIILEEFQMPKGIRLQLASARYIKNYELTREAFYDALLSAPLLAACRAPGSGADEAALRAWRERWASKPPAPPEPPIPSEPPAPNKAEEEALAATEKAKEYLSATQKAADGAHLLAEDMALRKAQNNLSSQEASEVLSIVTRYKQEAEEAAEKAEASAAKAMAAAKKANTPKAQKAAEEAAVAAKSAKISENKAIAAENTAIEQCKDSAGTIYILPAEEEALAAAKEAEQHLAAAQEAAESAFQTAKALEAQKKVSVEESNKALSIIKRYKQEAEEAKIGAEATAAKAMAAAEKADTPKARKAAEEAAVAVKSARASVDKAIAAVKKAEKMAGGTVPEYNLALLLRLGTGKIYLIKEDTTVIGTLQGQADIVISDNNRISRKHVEILLGNGGYVLHNLKPTNKTVVNGQRLEHDERVDLPPCSEIYLSNELFVLIYGDECGRVFDDRRICLLQSKKTGETKVIGKDGLMLDRYHRKDWRGEILKDLQISRAAHARVYFEQDRCRLYRVKAEEGKHELNPVYLNGNELTPGTSAELHNGDELSVVDTAFVYHEIRIGG